MKKIIFLAICLVTLACGVLTLSAKTSDTGADISYVLPTVVNVGDSLTLQTSNNRFTYSLSDYTICSYSSYSHRLTALKEGSVIIYKLNSKKEIVDSYALKVLPKDEVLTIDCSNQMTIGEEADVSAVSSIGSSITLTSSDENIIKIENGKVIACGIGMARVIAESVETSKTCEEYIVVVPSKSYSTKEEVQDVDMSDINEVFSLIAKHTTQAMMSVTSYMKKNGVSQVYDKGCGFVYKRITHMVDGSTNVTDDINYDNVSYYEYYFVTNKHIVTSTAYNSLTDKAVYTDADMIKLYYGESQTIQAEIVAYDTKVDVCVLKFTSLMYFPTVNLGDSSKAKNGEFILSIGSGTGNQYFRSISLGIVSSSERYISDDTDGDGTNDWDAQYIQHDAPINSGDCGSPIVNLKGEVIGINTAKKIVTNSGLKVENLSFAIPSEVLLSLLPSLEKGEVPERPVIGVSVISMVDILANKNYYLANGFKIPDGVTKGFYVVSVVEGKVADKAGILPDDIIIEFNDVKLLYMYQLRDELNRFIVGSGMITVVKVLRNGEEVDITIVF